MIHSMAKIMGKNKSVIEAIPVMTTLLPKSCLDTIQRLQRGFIWGDSDQGKKYHAVGWNKITQTKDNGGIGIRRLRIMNDTRKKASSRIK
jgi:hypothetical protein